MHTYTFIDLHVVFATWNRLPLLHAYLRPRLHAYVASVTRNLGITDVHAGGHADHMHLFGRFPPDVTPSVVVGRVKQSASHWLSQELKSRTFRWQRGFAAFSVSHDRRSSVIRYIQRQEEHHRRRTFTEEFEGFLRQYGVRPEDAHLL